MNINFMKTRQFLIVKTKENIMIIELLAYYYLEFVKSLKKGSVFALLNN